MKKVSFQKIVYIVAVIWLEVGLCLMMDPVYVSILKLWRYACLEQPNAYCRSAHTWERQAANVLTQSAAHNSQAVFCQISVSEFLIHPELDHLFVF